MAIWDFNDYSLKDLMSIKKHIEALEDLGFNVVDDDAMVEIDKEIESRGEN